MAPFPVHPNLFHFGSLSLPTFGALLAVGLMAGIALSQRTARLAGLDPERLWNAGFFAVAFAFLVSRGLLIVENWHTFLHFPLLLIALPSLTALGLVLTLAATAVWLRTRRIPLQAALEAWTPCGLLVWGFVALGHLAEGSDPGMPTMAFWGVHMHRDTGAQQPVALLVALAGFLLAFVCYGLLRKGLPAAGIGFGGAGLAQVLIGFLRQPGPSAPLGLDQLQWVGFGLLAVGGALLVREATSPAGSFAARSALRDGR